jgi:hypothetical protein
VLEHATDGGVEQARLQPAGDDATYRTTPSAEPPSGRDGYLLMGRGYVDRYDYGAVLDQPAGGGLTPRDWQRPSLLSD